MVFYLGYVLGPGSLFLLVFVWCPQLLQNRRYSVNTSNHRRNPTHQMKALELADPWLGLADFYGLCPLVCCVLVTGGKRV